MTGVQVDRKYLSTCFRPVVFFAHDISVFFARLSHHSHFVFGVFAARRMAANVVAARGIVHERYRIGVHDTMGQLFGCHRGLAL